MDKIKEVLSEKGKPKEKVDKITQIIIFCQVETNRYLYLIQFIMVPERKLGLYGGIKETSCKKGN